MDGSDLAGERSVLVPVGSVGLCSAGGGGGGGFSTARRQNFNVVGGKRGGSLGIGSVNGVCRGNFRSNT